MQVANEPSAKFATIVLQDNLFDAVTDELDLPGVLLRRRLSRRGVLRAAVANDGRRARPRQLPAHHHAVDCFKFVLVPIGARLAGVYSRDEFATVFALIWGSYIVTDALAEIGGSLFGKQTSPRAGGSAT